STVGGADTKNLQARQALEQALRECAEAALDRIEALEELLVECTEVLTALGGHGELVRRTRYLTHRSGILINDPQHITELGFVLVLSVTASVSGHNRRQTTSAACYASGRGSITRTTSICGGVTVVAFGWRRRLLRRCRDRARNRRAPPRALWEQNTLVAD